MLFYYHQALKHNFKVTYFNLRDILAECDVMMASVNKCFLFGNRKSVGIVEGLDADKMGSLSW